MLNFLAVFYLQLESMAIPLILLLNALILVLQEYSFQITLRQQWNDNRLAFKNKLRDGMAGKRTSILPKVTTRFCKNKVQAAFVNKAEPCWDK